MVVFLENYELILLINGKLVDSFYINCKLIGLNLNIECNFVFALTDTNEVRRFAIKK